MASRGFRGGLRGPRRNFTDAREVLQRKNAPSRRLGTYVTDLSEKLQSRQNLRNRLGQRGSVIKRNVGRFNKTFAAGFRKGFIPAFNRNQGNNVTTVTQRPKGFQVLRTIPTGALAGNRMVNAKDKFVKVRGGNITVTSKHSNLSNIQIRQREPVEDELEQMTLADLPDIQLQRPVLPRPPVIALQSIVEQRAEPRSDVTSLLVSNLKPTVTEEDIIELFSVVGQLSHAQLLHPGAALVSYTNKEDAKSAMDHYNNVTLDGIPMQCTVFSLDQQKSKPSISSRLGERAILPSARSSSFLSPQVLRPVYPPTTGLRSLRLVQPQIPVRPHPYGIAGAGSNTKFTVCLN